MRKQVLAVALGILLMSSPGAAAERVLVVGLDGADWDVIEPLVDSGEMPNLAALMEDGARGNLTTTLPVESPVAWTSMTTGTTPGKHGIYGFLERRGGEFVPTTADDVRRERVWDRAGEAGEVVVVNVPQTFPPREVNGYLVSGYLSIEDAGYTYPADLQGELAADGYRIEALEDGFEEGEEDAFLSRLNGTVENRTDAAERLLDRADWTLGFVVYTGLDRVQHYLWDRPERVEGHYRDLDRKLGRLLEHADENTTVMVVSDHGFGPLEKNVYLNTWLRKEGYLEIGGSGSGGALARLGLTQQNVVDLLGRVGLLGPVKGFFDLLGFNPGTRLPSPELSDIDFDRSVAYAGNYGGKIYLTGNADDRAALLDELERKLENLTDPETGDPVFAGVHRPGEIYTGDMEGAPDLVLDPAGPYRAVGFLGHKEVVKRPPTKTGTHRKDGIYVVSPADGGGDADITDVAPTVLDALGMEVPAEMDGRSLLD